MEPEPNQDQVSTTVALVDGPARVLPSGCREKGDSLPPGGPSYPPRRA